LNREGKETKPMEAGNGAGDGAVNLTVEKERSFTRGLGSKRT